MRRTEARSGVGSSRGATLANGRPFPGTDTLQTPAVQCSYRHPDCRTEQRGKRVGFTFVTGKGKEKETNLVPEIKIQFLCPVTQVSFPPGKPRKPSVTPLSSIPSDCSSKDVVQCSSACRHG